VIVHEAARSFGAGAEISANLAECSLLDLKAPVVRVTGFDTIMPLFKNEHYYMPHTEDIIRSVQHVMSFG
jgi:pyruvate dehydrogenase E1 component beta subunit